MTWAKFGSEFRDECAEAGLSDSECRTHFEAVMYLYGIENMDLRIKAHLIRRWAGSMDYAKAVEALVARGFWRRDGDDYVIVHHADVVRQSIGYQRAEREKARVRMAARRSRDTTDVPPNVPPNVLQTQSVSHTGTKADELVDAFEQMHGTAEYLGGGVWQ